MHVMYVLAFASGSSNNDFFQCPFFMKPSHIYLKVVRTIEAEFFQYKKLFSMFLHIFYTTIKFNPIFVALFQW